MREIAIITFCTEEGCKFRSRSREDNRRHCTLFHGGVVSAANCGWVNHLDQVTALWRRDCLLADLAFRGIPWQQYGWPGQALYGTTPAAAGPRVAPVASMPVGAGGAGPPR